MATQIRAGFHIDPATEPAALDDTLPAVLRRRAAETPDAPHIHLRHEDGRVEEIRYRQLLEGAEAVARGLVAAGIHDSPSGERPTVALMQPTSPEFFSSFFGTWLAGAVPVPIYPPARPNQIEEYAARQSAILRNAGVRALLTFRQAERLARLLQPRIPTLRTVATTEKLASARSSLPPDGLRPEDIGLIQYTSGSTGDPKGVALTHRSLIANVRAIGHGVEVRPEDVTVCWLPLHHDMGLIGCWLFSLYFGIPLAVLSPQAFLRRPERWLWTLHAYRGSLSPAPNFAYELAVRKIAEEDIAGLDLSSWRVALNGAEPVNPETLNRFIERFARYGFRPEAMMPVYGLAENSVALSFPPLGRRPRLDRVERESFRERGRALPVRTRKGGAEAEGLRFPSVGTPLPGHEIRIVDDAGREVAERVVGQVQFRGVSAMQGYYRNPEATRVARTADGWLRTGDLGYRAEGELYLTGREKDLIIQAGRNIHPQEVEEIAAEVEGVRRGCVAAFSVPDPRTGTEGLVLVAETRETRDEARKRIVAEIARRVGREARISPDVVHLVPPQTVPKTPSGKLRRDTCRQLYLRGALTPTRAPVWLQVMRLTAGNTWELVKRSIAGGIRGFRS